jgi:hypothetical protein
VDSTRAARNSWKSTRNQIDPRHHGQTKRLGLEISLCCRKEEAQFPIDIDTPNTTSHHHSRICSFLSLHGAVFATKLHPKGATCIHNSTVLHQLPPHPALTQHATHNTHHRGTRSAELLVPVLAVLRLLFASGHPDTITGESASLQQAALHVAIAVTLSPECCTSHNTRPLRRLSLSRHLRCPRTAVCHTPANRLPLPCFPALFLWPSPAPGQSIMLPGSQCVL